MSSLRGKDDWLKFFCAFESRKDREQTLADFCRAKKVGYKTARNWASKLRGENLYPVDGVSPITGTGTDQGQGQGQNGDDAPKDKGNRGASKSRAQKADPTPSDPGQKRDVQKLLNSLANLKPFVPGESRTEVITHGAYTKYLPPDIQAELNTYGRNELREVIEEIRLTKGRLMLVQRNKAQWDANAECGTLTDEDYSLDEIETSKGGINGDTRKEKRKRPDFEFHEDRLTRRLAWLMQVQDQLAKKASFTADEAIAMRREIIERGEANGWTYAQIGMEIEKYGIELPFTLQALIRHELEQPIVDDQNQGFTDEELDQLSVEYRESMAKDDAWLQERKSEVQEIHQSQDATKAAS